MTKFLSDLLLKGAVTLTSFVGTGTRMVVSDPDGKLGVQTVPTFTETDTFDSVVQRGNVASGNIAVTGSITIGSAFPGSSQRILADPGSGEFIFQNSGGGGFSFLWNQNAATVMKLTTGNNLLIGTTTDAGYKLDVNGTGYFKDGVTLTDAAAVNLSFSLLAKTGGTGGINVLGVKNGAVLTNGNFGVFDNYAQPYYFYTNLGYYFIPANARGPANLNWIYAGGTMFVAGGNTNQSNGWITVNPTFNYNGAADAGTKYIGFYYKPDNFATLGTQHYAIVADAGRVQLGDLAGSGTRMVVADATGLLTTQALPAGGTTTGTGTAGQVTYWTGTNTQAGSANFTWDNANSKLTVNGDTHIAGVATFGNGLRFDFDQATRIFNGNRIGYQSNDNTMQHWFANQIGAALSGATSSLVTFQAANGGITLTTGLAIASFLGDNNQEVLRVQADGYVKAPFHMTVGTSTPNAQTRLTVMGSQTFSKSIVLDSTWNYQTSWAMRNGVYSTEFNLGGSTKSSNEGGPGSLQISTYNANTNTFRYPITFFANANVSFGGTLGSVPADNGSTVQVNGSVQSSSLSGTGTRMVVASAAGVLGVQAIPTGSLQGAVDADKNTSGSLAIATTIVKSVSATTYSGVFFDYVVKNGTNVRVGSVVAITNGTTVESYETLSNDIGNTNNLTFTVTLGSGNINLNAVAAATGFTVIVSTRAI
jgi:hypothetical protein